MSSFPLPINLVATPAAVLIAWKILVPAIKAFALAKKPTAAATILPIIGLPILAFGSSKYNKGEKVDKNGIFSVEK